MGIFVDYSLRFEGEEEELLERLKRVRHRVQTLPIERTGDIIRVQPVVNYPVLMMIDALELPIPEAVAPYLQPLREQKDLPTHCIMLGTSMEFGFPRKRWKLLKRWAEPAIRLATGTEFWNPEDYPKWIRDGSIGFGKHRIEALDVDEIPDRADFYGLTASRSTILYLFAQAMVSVGYILYIHPGEGSETVNLGLTTMSRGAAGLWLGKSFTKTQYARDLQRAHTNVVGILDIVNEEGLLLDAKDDAGYYKDRDWGRARRRIAAELAVVGALSGGLTSLLKQALDVPEDTPVKTVENNAGSAFDRLRDMGATLEEIEQGLDELREAPPEPEADD